MIALQTGDADMVLLPRRAPALKKDPKFTVQGGRRRPRGVRRHPRGCRPRTAGARRCSRRRPKTILENIMQGSAVAARCAQRVGFKDMGLDRYPFDRASGQGPPG
jgi:hypothetical protein